MKDITSHADPVSGRTEIALSPTDTKFKQGTSTYIDPELDYYYDIFVKESTGDVYKADEGRVKFDASPNNRA